MDAAKALAADSTCSAGDVDASALGMIAAAINPENTARLFTTGTEPV